MVHGVVYAKGECCRLATQINRHFLKVFFNLEKYNPESVLTVISISTLQYRLGGGGTHHWAWKMPKKAVPRQSWPGSVKTARRLLKETWRSGSEHSSLAFWKVVHFFCRVLVPPRSPW